MPLPLLLLGLSGAGGVALANVLQSSNTKPPATPPVMSPAEKWLHENPFPDAQYKALTKAAPWDIWADIYKNDPNIADGYFSHCWRKKDDIFGKHSWHYVDYWSDGELKDDFANMNDSCNAAMGRYLANHPLRNYALEYDAWYSKFTNAITKYGMQPDANQLKALRQLDWQAMYWFVNDPFPYPPDEGFTGVHLFGDGNMDNGQAQWYTDYNKYATDNNITGFTITDRNGIAETIVITAMNVVVPGFGTLVYNLETGKIKI